MKADPVRLTLVTGLAVLMSPAGPLSAGEPGRGRLRVHDPSTIVRCQDDYWLFSTGPGVLSRRSGDLADWMPGPPVFPTIPKWTGQAVPGNRGYFWAPDVIRVGDRYLLYYSVSTWGKNSSVIALATATALDPANPQSGWTDRGEVIRSGPQDGYNAIDPSLCLDAEGRLWLAFGSFWSGIKLVELDPATGRRLAPDSPIHSLAHHAEIEAPCLVERAGDYYLFVNWGLCCRGVKSTYRIRVGRSRHITGPYLDRDGKDLLQGGGSALVDTDGRFVGPGHAGVLRDGTNSWLSYHFYDGDRAGQPALAVRRLQWDAQGWPQPGEWISPRP